VVIVVQALVAAAAAYAAATPPNFNLPWRTQPRSFSYTGTRTTITWALSSYDNLLLASLSKPDWGEDIDVTHVRCHGGVARVTWYVGNLEPETASSGMHIMITMDGKRIATMIRGGYGNTWEDAPASVETVTRCGAGMHTFTAQMREATQSSWGVPYANTGERVQRGFIIEEIWNPRKT
jgi:hypothetical protein